MRRRATTNAVGFGRDVGRGIRTRELILIVPTANIESETECMAPDGVYATRVIVDDGVFGSITSIGMRPTFDETVLSVEAHIFDFNRDIYDQRIKLELIDRVRGERKFESPEALRNQIALDLSKAHEILATA